MPARYADTRHVFLRKPDVVCQIAAVDREQLLGRRRPIDRERYALFSECQNHAWALRPLEVEVGEPHIRRVAFLRVELDFTMKEPAAQERDLRTEPQATKIPLMMFALIGLDEGELVLERSEER